MKAERSAIATAACVAASFGLSEAALETNELTGNHRTGPTVRRSRNPSRYRSLIQRFNRDQRKLNHAYVRSEKDLAIRIPNSLSAGIPKRGQCLDDASYRSKIGSTCEVIRQAGLICEGFTDLGFTPAETEELKMSCPNACGLCNDEAAADPITISINSPTMAPTASSQKESGVGTCFDESCVDDSLYIGKFNFNCETIRSGSFDCTKFGVMSYDNNEIAELIKNCPCACNIECAVSDAPSAVPTLLPSVAPSALPTSQPSTSPSVKPSGEPTIEPSGEPSSPPSASPSLNPTTSHSNAPSRPPVSSAPSNSPTVSPTALLSANPLASNATGNQTAAFLSLCLVLISSFVAQIIFQ